MSTSSSSSSSSGTSKKRKQQQVNIDQLVTVALHDMSTKIDQTLHDMSTKIDQTLHDLLLQGGGSAKKAGDAAAAATTKEEKKKKKKRALNPNIQFNSFVSTAIRTAQPNLAQPNMLRKQGELWSSIGEDGKATFKTFLEEQGIKGQRIKMDSLPMDAFHKLGFELDYSTPPKPKGE